MRLGGRKADLPRFPRLTVLGWFRVAFAVLAVLVVIAAVVIAWLLVRSRDEAADLENSVLPAQAQAYRLQGALVDQETGVRGFALARSPAFLQPYTAGLATEASAVARLRAMISGNRQLWAQVAAIEAAAGAWRRSYAMPLISLARHGPLSGRDAALLDRSKQSFDHLRTLFSAQDAGLAATASRDSAGLRGSRDLIDWGYAAVLLAVLLAAGALSLVLQRAVVLPLGRLRADARKVMAGDFGHRIETTGPADLRDVAADVEAMRSELLSALASARAAQEVSARQAASLDSQATELLRSNSELEQFAYVASHDLQEPLRKVASFCQLLEKRYGEQLDERGRQYIEFAVDGAKRLQVLINDLLTFSRVGRVEDERFRLPLPLDVALDSALAGLGAAIEEAGAVIERPDRLPVVMGDATLLAMVWQNLIGNGIKFARDGQPPVVRITAAPASGETWQLCVQDNGIGIPAEFAEKVFVIFQRLHGRDAYPGTGIGLALCRRIIQHHGGDIGLDTGYTGGARLCFTLPGVSSAGASSAGASSAGASSTIAEGNTT
jgi:signal transduction histidine kinase